jgi:hypothetical protein
MTFQELINFAGKPLNDEGINGNPKRWPDALRLDYALEGLWKLRRERPDLFIFNLAGELSYALAQAVPVDAAMAQMLRDYIVARCLSHNNDVGAEGSSSTGFFQLAASGVR